MVSRKSMWSLRHWMGRHLDGTSCNLLGCGWRPTPWHLRGAQMSGDAARTFWSNLGTHDELRLNAFESSDFSRLALHFSTPAIINSMVLVLGHSNHGAWQDLLRPQCLKELRRLVDATDVTCSEKAAENKSWWAFLNSEDLLLGSTSSFYRLFMIQLRFPKTMCPVVNDLPPEICRPGDFGAHQQLARVQWSHSASHQRPAAEWDVTLWSHGCQWMARTTRTRQFGSGTPKQPEYPERSRKIQNHTWLNHVVSGWW